LRRKKDKQFLVLQAYLGLKEQQTNFSGPAWQHSIMKGLSTKGTIKKE